MDASDPLTLPASLARHEAVCRKMSVTADPFLSMSMNVSSSKWVRGVELKGLGSCANTVSVTPTHGTLLDAMGKGISGQQPHFHGALLPCHTSISCWICCSHALSAMMALVCHAYKPVKPTAWVSFAYSRCDGFVRAPLCTTFLEKLALRFALSWHQARGDKAGQKKKLG